MENNESWIYAANAICRFFTEQDCDRAEVSEVKNFVYGVCREEGGPLITPVNFAKAVGSIGLVTMCVDSGLVYLWPEGKSKLKAWQDYSALLLGITGGEVTA